MLSRLKDLVDKLKNNSSRLAKESILKEYENDSEVKQILYFIFNPYIITGISTKKLNKVKHKVLVSIFDINQDYDFNNPLDLLKYLKEHNTGKDDDLIIVERFAGHHRTYEDLIYAIATKDLKLGVQATTLNKVYGEDFVPTFDVMLAQKYFDDPDKLLPEGTEFILTEKLDGVRCVYVSTVNGKFFSRQGQAFEGLIELEDECKNLPLGFAYDGELLLENNNNLDSKDLYRETMKVVSSDKEKRNIIFNIFDMIPIEDFYKGYCNIPAEIRKRNISDLFFTPIWEINKKSFKYIKEVEVLYQGDNKQVIEEYLNKITKVGGEGVMINIAQAPYECKRSKNLLKVKKMQTADVRVIALEPGTGKNYNKLGALRVEFIGPDNKIYTCSVGSGLSDEDRLIFWNHPELIEDKIIEIQYFEISSNQNGGYGLRFPVFKHIREDKTEISMY